MRKRCPICESDAIIKNNILCTRFWVECLSCHLQTDKVTHAMLAQHLWNTRTDFDMRDYHCVSCGRNTYYLGSPFKINGRYYCDMNCVDDGGLLNINKTKKENVE